MEAFYRTALIGAEMNNISYGEVSCWLQKACRDLGFGSLRWTTHGLRRGGATFPMESGADMTKIMELGRWLSLRRCRAYCRPGEAALLWDRATFPAEATVRVARLATLGHTAFAAVGA